MPQTTLEASDVLKRRAEPEDEDTLKLALLKKVRADYEAFKETHPGLQKHPGVEVYKTVTTQVMSEGQHIF